MDVSYVGPENLKWRSRTRIVTFVDVVLSFGVLMFYIGSIIYFSIDRDMFSHFGADSKHKELLFVMWITIAVITSLAFCTEIWSAVRFLQATKIGGDSGVALWRAKIYRNVNIVLLIFEVVDCGIRMNWPLLVIHCISRLVVLFSASMFIKELL